MSLGSRIAIAVVALLSAAGFYMTAVNPGSVRAAPIVFYGMSLFCIVIAIACLAPKSHPLTLRVIGAVIFLVFASGLYSDFQTQNWRKAMMGFIVWGLPSGYVAIVGRYPSWGKGAAGFNGKSAKKLQS